MNTRLLISIFTLLASLLVFGACNKKNTTNNHPVPYVAVALSVYPGDPSNFDLQAIGGWKYIDGGLNGLVVYRKSEQEFIVLERTSSYLPNDKLAKVYVQSDNFTLRDTISDSQWRIFDGEVTKAPATWPLRQYGANYDGNLLRISN